MRVKNWHQFQHFKDRRPPWRKLYRDLLDDMDWHELDPVAAKALVMIWLIASENDGNLPDTKRLAFRLRMTEKQTVQLLDSLSHWLEQTDISTISDCNQDDAPETETEEEIEKKKTEKKASPKAPRFDPLSIQLPACVPADSWGQWVSYRRARKIRTTEQTWLAQLANLEAWAESGHDPARIIAASITNGWQGLFEPKVIPMARGGPPAMSHADQSKLAAARAIFGTDIEGENHGTSARIIDVAATARPALGG